MGGDAESIFEEGENLESSLDKTLHLRAYLMCQLYSGVLSASMC